MKSAAPFLALGGGVIAIVVGIFVFGDQFGIGGKKPEPTTPVAAVNKTALPAEPSKSTPAKSEEEPSPVAEAEPEVAAKADKDGATEVASLPKSSETEEVGLPDTADTAKETPAEPEPAAGVQPSFDVVRVEPDGQTLVAGKANPGWKVELKNGSMVLSSAEADANGEWVMILDEPLRAGVSDLSLAAKSAEGGEPVVSQSNVTVAMPEDGKGELLVIETKPGEASRVLAKVVAPKEESQVAPKPVAPVSEAPKEEPSVVAKAEEAQEVVSDAVNKTVGVVKEEAADVANKVAEEATVAEEKVAAVAEKVEEAVTQQVDAVTKEVKDPVATPREPVEAAKPASEPVEVAKVEEVKPEPEAKPEPVVPAVVSIEAVEIEGDTLFVAGAAEPAGSLVRLYVDNKSISNSRSGVTGRFLFDGEISLEAGPHQARVDLIDPATGKVATRAEVSFSKKPATPAPVAAPEATADAGNIEAQGSASDTMTKSLSATAGPAEVKTRKVIIRRGDNLWEIARRVYGAGIRYSTIYDTNVDQIRNPHWIYPGQVFELPEGEDGWDKNFDSVESPDESDQAAMLDKEAAQ